MNTKRIIFWVSFAVVLVLIVWGLIVAMNKSGAPASVGTPREVTSADHILGRPDAPVTIIEYSDFQCPACASYAPLFQRLIEDASTTVRLVYRHFPLDNLLPNGQIQHPNAVPTAQAAEAAALQGKFEDMLYMLFDRQDVWKDVKDIKPVLESYAEKIGLDMGKYRADYDSEAVKEAVKRDKAEALALRLSYTPSLFLNGKLINNPGSYEELKSIVEAAASPVSR